MGTASGSRCFPRQFNIFKESGASQRECQSTPICAARGSGRNLRPSASKAVLSFAQFSSCAMLHSTIPRNYGTAFDADAH